ncbi:hypothetical protein GCM10027052_18350 [Parafrigoribacterium mesophilum]|uniref:hypothetical protein n=1 Tax=Parafrigoribacterium mesophilum TaxID=433646 RepID=UPI0031FDB639
MTNLRSLSSEAIDRLTADTEPWLSCDDCFEHVDVVIDALVVSSASLSEEFRVHLRSCPACHEEARSLAAIVAAEHGLSPAEAVARLDSAVEGLGA